MKKKPYSRFYPILMFAMGIGGLFFSTRLFSEAVNIGMAHVLGSSSVGILDGRRPNRDFELTGRTVMLLTNGHYCTGTVIEGYILTAAHCLTAGVQTQIYGGDHPDLTKPPLDVNPE